MPQLIPPFPSRVRAAVAALLAVVAAPRAAVSAAEGDAESPPPAEVVEAGQEAPEKPAEAIPGYFEQDGEARGIAVAGERGIALDIDAIREAQDETLAYQAHDAGEAWFAPSTNWFCRRIDAFHDGAFVLLDNLVRILDLSWALPENGYRAELSSLSLVPIARVGGRGKDGDFEAKLKVRADTALPGLARRIHLVFDNLGRDSLPGTDPMKQESDWRLGINGGWDFWRHLRFDLDGGARLRSINVVGYASAALKWQHDFAGGVVRASPSVFYYTDRTWGQDFRTSWQRWFGPGGRWGIDLSAAEKNTDRDNIYDFEQTVKLAWARSDRKTRGLVFQASLFPHLREGDGQFTLDDALVNLGWKSPVYRRWCYATITPQVDFAKEDDRRPRFSLRFSLEILFGGESSRLL